MAKAKLGHRSNDAFLDVFARRRQQMRKWLLESYDFTIIDCPPSLALQVKVFLSVADGYILPCVPDRLSVRGAIRLVQRLEIMPYKLAQVGTLWSLYREQNHVHREMVTKSRLRENPLQSLPYPFDTVIPNATAVADSVSEDRSPKSFRAKYTSAFAKLFEKLCGEIVTRSQWGIAEEKEMMKPEASAV